MNIRWLTDSISDYYIEILILRGDSLTDESKLVHEKNASSEFVVIISDRIKSKFEQSLHYYFLNIGIETDTNKIVMDMERNKGVRVRSHIYPYPVNNIIKNELLLTKLLSIIGEQRIIYFDFLEDEHRFISEVIERNKNPQHD